MDRNPERLFEAVGSVRLFASGESRRQFLRDAVVVLVALGLLLFSLRRQLSVLRDPAELRALVRGFGLLGPVVLVVLQAAQVVVAPVPGQVLAVVSGYLYGPWFGTLYNVIGITIGSTIAFWLSRRYGRSYVERIAHEEVLAAFDALDDTHVGGILFGCFLVPGLPDDVICFLGGLSDLSLRRFVVIAVVGRTPSFFLVNVLGSSLWAGRLGVSLGVSAALVVLSLLGYLLWNRLLGATDEE